VVEIGSFLDVPDEFDAPDEVFGWPRVDDDWLSSFGDDERQDVRELERRLIAVASTRARDVVAGSRSELQLARAYRAIQSDRNRRLAMMAQSDLFASTPPAFVAVVARLYSAVVDRQLELIDEYARRAFGRGVARSPARAIAIFVVLGCVLAIALYLAIAAFIGAAGE